MRAAIDQFFLKDGVSTIDALVSLTGFSLVGGPAYNDCSAASDALTALDVPYIAAQATEFQSLETWEASEQGLSPVESTMIVAIPEIDGATGPIVFGGRSDRSDASAGAAAAKGMRVHAERASMLARRVAKLVQLRRTTGRIASSGSSSSISLPTPATRALRLISPCLNRCSARWSP